MITFHTNLDEAQPHVRELNRTWFGGAPVPSVGHEVELPLSNGRVLPLRVVAVRWDHAGDARVELHIAQHGMSIRDWMEWFKRHTRHE